MLPEPIKSETLLPEHKVMQIAEPMLPEPIQSEPLLPEHNVRAHVARAHTVGTLVARAQKVRAHVARAN